VLNSHGFKLWRFGKVVPWSAIKAIGVEPQPVFSTAFFLKPVVSRMTVYEEKPARKLFRKGKAEDLPPRLVPHSIPSFQFAPVEFASLLAHICQRSFGFIPDSANLLVADDSQRSNLKPAYEKGARQRLLLSFIIALGLVMFLGRKATLNYSFNEGNKAMTQHNYERAAEHYRVATTVEQPFAPAWDRLARCEYRLGKFAEAKEHWKKALYFKPDLVEPLVGLSNLAMQERNFPEAKRLLDKAARFAPSSIPTYINLAELNIKMGNYDEAVDITKRVLQFEKTNGNAWCLLIRAKVRQGKVDEAQELMDKARRVNTKIFANPFCQLVLAELKVARGDTFGAKWTYDRLQKLQPLNMDLLLDLADMHIYEKNADNALFVLDTAQNVDANNPWVYIKRAQTYMLSNNRESAFEQLKTAAQLPGEDKLSWLSCARLMRELGHENEAQVLERRAAESRLK
jgi:tetratricopeptide (TPR) repeat protein